jgi:hypothetical protein
MKRLCTMAVLSAGCVDIQVDFPMICAQAMGVRLENPTEGLPDEFSDAPIEVGGEVVQENIDGIPEGLSTDVMFFEGRLTPTNDQDLGFVEKVRIHLAPLVETDGLPSVDLFSFYRDPDSRTSDIAVQASPDSVDLAAYLSDGGAVFGFELSASSEDFPDEVVFDAEMCFSAGVHFREDLILLP